ncbi:MAG TPA: hypothetical protein VGF54_09985 [Streptosporangiaceae bacterium]|jgi:hypothetical protein
MSGSDLFLIAFAAVGVMILVTVWAAMVLEAGARPPRRAPEATQPGDAPGQPKAPERKAA